MNPFTQISTLTQLALESLPRRAGAAVVTAIGVATVVAVMTSILAMSAGLRRFTEVTDQPERAVVLSAASPSEYAGNFSPAQVAIIGTAPGVRRLPDGRPMVQPLAAAPVQLLRQGDGVPGYVFLRGSGPIGDSMNKASLHLTTGRMYRPGLRELIVGRAIRQQYQGVELGDQVLLHSAPWTVVGAYEDQGGIDEDGLVGDVDMVRADLGTPGYQSVGVMLRSAADFDRFRDALLSNPQLDVKVERLSDYYGRQISPLLTLFNVVGYLVGSVMAVGAICTALTTLYAAVAARAREIATLRAIGFGAGAVVISILVEAMTLAIPAALVGLGLAALAFDGHGVATAGVLFQATVTPDVALTGAVVAVIIALIGGLFPALRAARLPLAEALRST